MPDVCPECGAAIPSRGSCRDNFSALLALEREVEDAGGKVAHFFAVSAYVLQHPDSMSYTVEALAWLRGSVRDALKGEVGLGQLRESARREGDRTRVTRREGDRVRDWGIANWTMTISDVLAGGVDGYCERARGWAASVIGDLDASCA